MTESPRQNTPRDRGEMIAMMRQALTSPTAGQIQVDDEQMVMLATGRIDEIPQPKRDQLLVAVSEDHDLADLLSQLAALELEPGMTFREGAESQEAKIHRLHLARFTSFVRVAWAASIVLLVGLLAWRITESGQVTATDSMPGQPRPSDLTVSDSHWKLAEQGDSAPGLIVGIDIALIIVLVICVVLGGAVLWPLGRTARSKSIPAAERGSSRD